MDYTTKARQIREKNQKDISELQQAVEALKADTRNAGSIMEKAVETGDYKTYQENTTKRDFALKRIPVLEKTIQELQTAPLIGRNEANEVLNKIRMEMAENTKKAIAEVAEAWRTIVKAHDNLIIENDQLRAAQGLYYELLREQHIHEVPANEGLFRRWVENASVGHDTPANMVDIPKFLKILNGAN